MMRGVAVTVLSAEPERVHHALVLASAAAAVGAPAVLFFTMAGCRALTPGGLGPAGEALDARLAAAGVATIGVLLESCAALGVRIIACDAGLAAEGLTAADLRPDLSPEIAGAVTYLAALPADAATFIV